MFYCSSNNSVQKLLHFNRVINITFSCLVVPTNLHILYTNEILNKKQQTFFFSNYLIIQSDDKN